MSLIATVAQQNRPQTTLVLSPSAFFEDATRETSATIIVQVKGQKRTAFKSQDSGPLKPVSQFSRKQSEENRNEGEQRDGERELSVEDSVQSEQHLRFWERVRCFLR